MTGLEVAYDIGEYGFEAYGGIGDPTYGFTNYDFGISINVRGGD